MKFISFLFIFCFLINSYNCFSNTTNYKFYNDKGEVITVRVPDGCEPHVGTVFQMWDNQTFTCRRNIDQTFEFLRPVMYFPYSDYYICDSYENLQNNTKYTILSNCAYAFHFDSILDY